MGLSTERKVFIGLFVIAGAALLVDQAILAPGSAGASVFRTDEALGLDSMDAAESESTPSVEHTAASLLNARLEQMSERIEIAPSLGSMIGAPMVASTGITPENTLGSQVINATPAASSMPADLPQLSAVMPTGNGGAAVLNGVLVRSGGVSPDGYRLITVRRRSVRIEKNGRAYTIAVPVTGG